MLRTGLTTLCALLAAAPAAAEFELSVYSGWQTAPHSDVSGNDPGGLGQFDFTAGWDGRSFEAPPHWGVRGTWWRNGGNLGFGLDFNHAKVYADDETLRDNGFDTLEFTDGLNIVTANVMGRFPLGARATPYLGGGLGVSVPYVEVETAGGSTFEYQLTGPAVAWMAGVNYELTPSWSIFGEYKGTYSQNEADLDNGGTLETDIITNALNLGVSFNF